jgi:hypothetical protein
MTEQEEMALRELAAKPHYLPQVSAALGPLSLWSKAGIEAEIRRAVEAEREECAKLCDEVGKESASHWPLRFANMIRARGNT